MLNKVQLIGNAGADANANETKTGQKVVNLSLATSMKYTKDGEKKTVTEWHTVIFWGKLAEIAQQFIKKGSPLYIEGRLKYNTFEDKNGMKHKTAEIVAESFKVLSKKETTGAAEIEAPEKDEAPF